MKPTDNNNDNKQPQMPIVTHLRRVVDMKSIDNGQNGKKARAHSNPKEKSQHHRSQTVLVSDAETPKQPREKATRNRVHAAGNDGKPADRIYRSNKPVAEYEAGTPRLVAPAPQKHETQPRETTTPKPAVKKPAAAKPATPHAARPAAPQAAHAGGSGTAHAPSAQAAESPVPTQSSKPAAAHHSGKATIKTMHSTRLVKARKRPTLHVSEKVSSIHRERLSLKTTKHAEKPVQSASITSSQAITGVAEKIDEALMLQSWRARQWSASIVSLSPTIVAQIPKCMPFVQAKLVNNICITSGCIESTVVDQVTSISLRQFTPGQWRAVINMLSDRAIFTTSLLNGELPEGIVGIFKQASLSLFPTKMREFSFTCSCCPKTAPCEHACALLLAFALQLEEDPFQILTLRGMTRDNLLSQLRDARSDQVVDEKNRHRISYELPAQNVDFTEFYEARGNFDELTFHIIDTPNTLLKRLGDPETWNVPIQLDSILEPIQRIASHQAEKLALCEIEEQNNLQAFASLKRPSKGQDREKEREHESRSPRKSSKSPQFVMPDLGFIPNALPPDIRETLSGDPIEIAGDIIRWLKNRGASDIRTLARRTRLHKTTIEAFLNAMCIAGITSADGEGERTRFTAIF